jgi:hypothetical protein
MSPSERRVSPRLPTIENALASAFDAVESVQSYLG